MPSPTLGSPHLRPHGHRPPTQSYANVWRGVVPGDSFQVDLWRLFDLSGDQAYMVSVHPWVEGLRRAERVHLGEGAWGDPGRGGYHSEEGVRVDLVHTRGRVGSAGQEVEDGASPLRPRSDP